MNQRDPALQRLLDKDAIRDVVYRYARGIDRFDLELVSSCYHPGATEDHGGFQGGVDDFLVYLDSELRRWERTMHFIGNVLIEYRSDDVARVESYAIAYHRVPASSSRPERDFVAALRYVDDFERRAEEWRIAARVCAMEWSRVDPVPVSNAAAPPESTFGRRDRSDAVYRR